MEGDALVAQRSDSHYTIVLNEQQPKVRHRFSVAHELSHLLLAPVLGAEKVHRRQFAPDQDQVDRKIEELCDKMAAAILMPQEKTREIIADDGESAACVPSISGRFDVSFEAAARRYLSLTSTRCALLFWRCEADGNPVNLRPPLSNTRKPVTWLGFDRGPSDPVSAGQAMYTDDIVTTRESFSLWAGTDEMTMTTNVHNATVDSFGRGRMQSRHIASFVYLNSGRKPVR